MTILESLAVFALAVVLVLLALAVAMLVDTYRRKG